MASYRSLPAQNPFTFDSDDSEEDGHIYDDDVDINIDIEDDGITVDEGTMNRNTANNTFNNDPFYKNLFHEIDSSNSDTNYSSSSTTSDTISISDLDDMPTPDILFNKDDLDDIIEEDEHEDVHVIDYNRNDMDFQHIFVDNPQQDKDDEDILLNDIRYENPVSSPKNKKRKKTTTSVKTTKSKSSNKAKGKATTRKPRTKQPKKAKEPEEFMLYKVPNIDDCLKFCKETNTTWNMKQGQIRVFCDYLIAAAINAQQKGKKVKKGDAIQRASMLAFGKSIYIRGGGVSKGSASDVISKAFHFITGYKRVKRT